MSRILNDNRRRYPCPSEMVRGGMVVLAVLVESEEGLCVYCAIMPDSPAFGDEKEWTQQWGNKVSFEEARSHFPGLEEKRYAWP